MKLKDSLYRITRQPAEGMPLEYEVRLDEKHFIYQAHFPEEPVTPGVCIIQIAKELLEDHLQQDYEIQQVKNVKFLSVLSPLKTPCVTYRFDKLTISEDTKACKAQIMVTAQEDAVAKLSIVLKPQAHD